MISICFRLLCANKLYLRCAFAGWYLWKLEWYIIASSVSVVCSGHLRASPFLSCHSEAIGLFVWHPQRHCSSCPLTSNANTAHMHVWIESHSIWSFQHLLDGITVDHIAIFCICKNDTIPYASYHCHLSTLLFGIIMCWMPKESSNSPRTSLYPCANIERLLSANEIDEKRNNFLFAPNTWQLQSSTHSLGKHFQGK